MMKYYFQKACFLCAIALIFCACGDVRNLTYFQKTRQHNTDTLNVAQFYVPRIQIGDLLSIPIGSLSNEASGFFNPYSASGAAAGAASGGANGSPGISQAAAPGYLVDANGEIEMPVLGNLKVLGYTSIQLRDTLKSILKRKKYLNDPTVVVRFLNFKVTMLGEISHPQVYNIPNEMITLPEAISMAGDLTELAQRDSIQIIRDVNGKKQIGLVNLNSRDIFNSPYYYLHSNDLVYVKPSKFKAQHNDRFITLFTFGTSVVSLLFIFLRR